MLMLGGLLATLFVWAFRRLPGEDWQFIACIPGDRLSAGWQAINLTWFGFFSASGYVLASALFILLMGAVSVSIFASLVAVSVLLAICAPASAFVARIVEGRRHGFTVAGAVFVGVLIAPLVFWAMNHLGLDLPIGAALAALCIAYVLGEGVGRLACISFGCCYGKPVSETRGWLRKFSNRFHFQFFGAAKKIAFASRLEGIKVVPVQAMTAVLHALVALACLPLFFAGHYGWTITLALATTQLWRVYSETFRADFRGHTRISAYQIMASITTLASLTAPRLIESSDVAPDIGQGFSALGTAAAVLILQLLWLFLFFFMGRSMQTGAELRFFVRPGDA